MPKATTSVLLSIIIWSLLALAPAAAAPGSVPAAAPAQLEAKLRSLALAEFSYYAQHESYATLQQLLEEKHLDPGFGEAQQADGIAFELLASDRCSAFLATAWQGDGAAWSIDRTAMITSVQGTTTAELLGPVNAVEHKLAAIMTAEKAYFAEHTAYASTEALLETGLLAPEFKLYPQPDGISFNIAVSQDGQYFTAVAQQGLGVACGVDRTGMMASTGPGVTADVLLARCISAAQNSTITDANGTNDTGEPTNMAEQPTGPVLVVFETTKGDIEFEVHPEWSPNGAARFIELVKAGYFDGAPWFRVIDRFVAQCGIAATPALNEEWSEKTIKDDPVVKGNRPGFVAFGKTGAPNSRTTHIFINLVDNADRLDAMGFSAFARVSLGMDIAQSLARCEFNDQYGLMQEGGMAAFKKMFPQADYIERAYIR